MLQLLFLALVTIISLALGIYIGFNLYQSSLKKDIELLGVFRIDDECYAVQPLDDVLEPELGCCHIKKVNQDV